MSKCDAMQFSDQMSCACGNVWDMNDPDPPKCGKIPDMTTNKPEVKRYTPAYGVDSVMRGHLFMDECERGAWVSLEDHEALQAECERLRKDAELWESIHDEIHRRADKEHALADRCDFGVTIMYEDYDAIDAAMQADNPC